VWVGGNRGVALFENGRNIEAPAPNAPSPLAVRCFAESPRDGAIWAAGALGLFRREREIWQEVKGPDANSLRELRHVYIDPEGTVWVAQGGNGLRRLRDGRWSLVQEIHGLPSREMTCIVPDQDGRWWLGSKRGVMRVWPADLNAVADGALPRLPGEVLTLADGLPSVECASGYQTTGLCDSQGRLWFPTLKGLAMIDPRRMRLNTNPPPVRIEEIQFRHTAPATVPPEFRPVGNNRDPQFAIDPSATTGRLRLPAGSRRIEIHYAALSFSAPEKVRFETRLKGSSAPEWLDVGTRRIARYHDLPPGDYEFEVRARNDHGVPSASATRLSFVVLPFFWQTAWFRVAVGLALLGLGGATSWALNRRRVQKALDRVRQERALTALQVRLAHVLENTSDIVGFATLDRKPTYLNLAGRRLLGLADDADLSGFTTEDFYTPAAHELITREALPTVKATGIWRGQTVARTLNGREIPLLQVMLAHRNEEGQIEFISSIGRDISELRQAQEALRQSEARYRAIVEDHTELIVRWRPDGTRTFVNEAVSRLLGQPKETLIGTSFLPLMKAEDQAALRERLRGLTPATPSASGENVVLGFDGQPRWICWTDRGVFDTDGRLVEIQSIGFDITARKQAETASKENEERLRLALDSANMGIWTWDIRRNRVEWSPQVFSIFGVTLESFGGTLESFTQTVLPEDRDHVGRAITACLNRVTPEYTTQFRVRRPDGAIRWVETRGRAYFAPNGEAERMAGVVMDVTEREEQAEAIARAEQKFRDLVESISDWVWEIDTQAVCTYCSPKVRDLLGLEPEDILGRSFFELMPPAESTPARRFFDALHTRAQPFASWQNTFQHKHGRLVALETSGVPILNAAGEVTGYRGVTRDVTERKRTEAALTAIVAGTASQSGEGFFLSLVEHLAKVLEAKWALVGEILPDRPDRVRVLGHWAAGQAGPTFEYDLPGTPCADVARSQFCFYARHVTRRFPHDDLLKRMGAESYVGVPMNDPSGRTIGLVAVIHDQPMDATRHAEPLLRTFAARAAAELLRLRVEAQLRQWNLELEARVRQRTDELQRVVNLMAGREVRMGELKRTIQDLQQQLLKAGLRPAASDPLRSVDDAALP
ncbi:MAG TPA: PAS domain S-box protein, partial [Methylomirabilota bacterium]|nr:PAS domain S-box protein [Methylomirabilota bacterium]